MTGGSDHRPIVVAQGSANMGVSGGDSDLKRTGVLEKFKKIGGTGGSAAPIKVKLKSTQI